MWFFYVIYIFELERIWIQGEVFDIFFFFDVFMWKKLIEKLCWDFSGWVVIGIMLFYLDLFEELCGN